MKRARTYAEIKPLVEMCKVGRLFDVQDWIAAGKPVNPPRPPKKGRRPRSPLQYAIDTGFHSLVQVLLEAGAEIENSWKYCAMSHALSARYYDIAKLLVEHGADVRKLDMYEVFRTWEPDLMVYFIEHGADVERDNPLARALCRRIRTALKIFKQYKDRFPSFQEQVNIALRHHCKEGNVKWVSLMLWAGADPHAKGIVDPESSSDWDGGSNALEVAALYGHPEVFGIKRIRVDPKHEHAHDVVSMACIGAKIDLLKQLLAWGYPVNDQANGGSSHVQRLFSDLDSCFCTDNEPREDNARARRKMAAAHLLVRNGARWVPEEPWQISQVRRSLLRMRVDYTVEIVWMMAKYGACERAVIEALMKSGPMRGHVAMYTDRIEQLVERLPARL